MKIAFLAIDCPPIYAQILEERPMGGTATGVVRLAEALQELGQEVTVITSHANPPSSLPRYIEISHLGMLGEVDILIIVRGWMRIFEIPFIRYKKCFLWTGDGSDSFLTLGIGDLRIVQKYDGLFAVSYWHADSLCKASGFPRLKTWVLKNGIHPPYFAGSEKRERRRLIYSSLPHRGLSMLPRIFQTLQKKYHDLQLHIYGSYNRNDPQWNSKDKPSDPALNSLLNSLETLPGCTLHGSIAQRELSREFMKAGILAYPCHFFETSCITAMEAQAAGCPIVTSNLGALQETIGEAGILIDAQPETEEYFRQYVDGIDKVLSDDQIYHKLSQAGLKQAEKLSWTWRAKTLLEYLTYLN